MRLTWATDIHLDFITNPNDVLASSRNLDVFCSLFKESDGVILSGDISLSPFLRDHLIALESRLERPIYFVLGNHDFWFSDFSTIRRDTARLASSSEYLKYLSVVPYIELSKDVFMIGHDGWYDGFYGEAKFSNYIMNDWVHITDYAPFREDRINHNFILGVARQQALIATQHVAKSIKSLLTQRKPQKIIVVTHVPPFTQPLEHARGNRNDMYPWYASKVMGDMLLLAANSNPHVQFEVFCGHCHTEYNGYITSNLLLHAGGAEYSEPKPQLTFSV